MMEASADSLDPAPAESEEPADGSANNMATDGGEGPAPGDPRRGRVWQWTGIALAMLVAAAGVGGAMYKVPYVALVPGSARDTEPLVEVEGLEAFPSEGELLLTTVRVRQRPNLWEYLWLKADGDTDIVAEEDILGGRSPQENREFNLQLMTDSKSIAIAVALQELGYDSIRSNGVVIAELVEGGAAEQVLTLGDTVTAIDGVGVTTTSELIDILGAAAPGDEITLTIESFDPSGADVAARDVMVVLGSKPDDDDAAFLGVGPTDRVDLEDNFDFVVDIDSGSVGGPSAGLAFTLAVLDELTPGELTGGATVAVTGTIDVSGRVGNVGGVAQKTAAVRDLGADVFLVPAGLGEAEIDRLVDRAGDDLKIIPVETLDDALEALASLGGEVVAVEEFAASNLS